MQEALALSKNRLLPALLSEFQAEIFAAWQSSTTPEDREKLHARQTALTLIRSKIDAATRRELGDKSAKQ